ncbi:hypothetical protein MHYP_G00092400 [Metynnis hypsauchen]
MIHHHSNGAKKARERRRKERRQKTKQLHIFSEGLRLRSIEHNSTGGWIAQRSNQPLRRHSQTPPHNGKAGYMAGNQGAEPTATDAITFLHTGN